MRATQDLPPNFCLAWSLDIRHNTRLNVTLQALSLVWMVLAAILLDVLVVWLRPDFDGLLQTGTAIEVLTGLLVILGVMIVIIVLHELVHGLFFWLFTRRTPEFGIGPGYAFAAMPDWYFPRIQYLLISLSPILALSGLGLLACAVIPLPWVGPLLIGVIFNAGAAIGDLYVSWLVLRQPGPIWVKDTGDGFALYHPQPR